MTQQSGPAGKVWRMGIVGAGLIAEYHAQAIRSLPNTQLAGIMDRGSGRAQEIAPELQHHANESLEAFVARDDIDIIAVTTPSGAHGEAAIAAARAGKHCIVEKPVEITLARIDEMIAAHAAAGTRLGGIFNSRYAPGARQLKGAVQAGRFGRITFAAATGPWWREQSYYDDGGWKGTQALDGGGALMNQGIHTIDMLQWLVGSPVTSVSGHVALLVHERIDVEDTGAATLRFANGALGQIAATTSMWPGQHRSLTLGGPGGSAALADGDLSFWKFREDLPGDDQIRAAMAARSGQAVGASDPRAGLSAEGHAANFAEFLAALDEGTPPPLDGAEARKAVAIILAVYESSRRGGAPVKVN